MGRRALTLLAVASMLVGAFAVPAPAAIHELVGSHCNGFHDPATAPNELKNLDPPGQIREGKSFIRALQASGVYNIQPGDSGLPGTPGLDLTTMPPTFGPLPAPLAGTDVFTVFVDNTRPNAKLGDEFVWGFFADAELGFSVYIQLYEPDHPAFEVCHNLQGGHD